MTSSEWFHQLSGVKGLLSDITGVLIDGHDGKVQAVPGAPEAICRLKKAGIPIRFITNETSCTKHQLVEKLNGFGFDISEEEVFPPPPAMAHVLKARKLRPYLLVHEAVLPEFSGVAQHDPNCVVLGDAEDFFTYNNLNQAFRVLMGLDKPVLFTMGQGKYYKGKSGLQLDVGAYTKALEYACGAAAEVVGKPSETFFMAALQQLQLSGQQVVMIGDDIVSDVGGAQACGMMGVQVRTGKFLPSDENHPSVKPDGYVDNLPQFVNLFLQHWK